MYALKTLLNQPVRFIITVCGVSLCVILILFLSGIYKGVSVGTLAYVHSSRADLWVLQRNSTNILRSTSILRSECITTIKESPGVSSVSPLLFILASVKLPECRANEIMRIFANRIPPFIHLNDHG